MSIKYKTLESYELAIIALELTELKQTRKVKRELKKIHKIQDKRRRYLFGLWASF